MAISVHDLCHQRGITLEQLSERSGLELQRVQAIYLARWTPSPMGRWAHGPTGPMGPMIPR